nr:MAG TPA: hypothetical protein [Caudoviricetes sp.]
MRAASMRGVRWGTLPTREMGCGSTPQLRTERRKVCNAACLTHGVIHHRCAGGCGIPEILPTP